MENDSTTVVDNPSDEHVPGASITADPNSTTESKQTPGADQENSDPSKSTETPAADDDKSKEKPTGNADDTPASTPKFDDDLDEWIAKRKAPAPTTDEERQAYQDLRNEQREYSRSQQAKKQAEELSKAIDESKIDNDDDEDDDDDPLAKEVRELREDRDAERTARLQSEFYTDNKVTEGEGKAIAEVFKEKIESETTEEGKIAAFNYWKNPNRLPMLLKEARSNLSNADIEAAKEAAQQEERERIAKESEANSANRGAKQTLTSDKSEDEARLERFSNW